LWTWARFGTGFSQTGESVLSPETLPQGDDRNRITNRKVSGSQYSKVRQTGFASQTLEKPQEKRLLIENSG
jgi:hypothetical protein